MSNKFWNAQKMKEDIEHEQDRNLSGSSTELRGRSQKRSLIKREAAQMAMKKNFEAAERKAYESGAEKTGGLLGLGIFGGSYSGKSKEDFATGGKDMTGEGFSSAMGKAGAAKSLVEMGTGESIGTSLTGGGQAGGAVDGALSGAATGAAFGPIGAGVGAVAGAVMGAAQSRAAAKAHNAQLEAKKEAAIGEIEQEKGRQISQALGQMGQRMRIT